MYDLSPAIANAIQQDPIGEPYLAPDMLLALCHHASTHDLSESAISKLLARPNLDGLGREREKEREREGGREREGERGRGRERVREREKERENGREK